MTSGYEQHHARNRFRIHDIYGDRTDRRVWINGIEFPRWVSMGVWRERGKPWPSRHIHPAS